MDEEDHVDLFGDEDDTDHFFLPEHYVQNGDGLGDHAADESFDGPAPAEQEQLALNWKQKDVDDVSLGSDGLDDDDELPEEEEATNPAEDFNYEDLIASAQRNVEKSAGGRGHDVHLPDLGGLPPAASGAMAKWMAGVEAPGVEDDIPDEDSGFEDAMSKEEILKEYYPSFHPNKVLNFTDLFGAKVVRTESIPGKRARQCLPTKLQLDVEYDSAALFRSSARRKRRAGSDTPRTGIIDSMFVATNVDRNRLSKTSSVDSDIDEEDRDMIMACDDWESYLSSAQQSSEQALIVGPSDHIVPKMKFLVEEQDLWMNEGLFEGKLSHNRVSLDMNDAHLYLTQVSDGTKIDRHNKHSLPRRYNFSNDEAYAMLQETHQSRVRSNLTQLSLEHAGFSDRLQSPYYKTTLSKSEARAYHRPPMVFKPNQEVHFSRAKPRKKRDKERAKDPKVQLQYTKNISLSDNSGFVCLEYSEEYPTILSNVGMAAKIVNYYRKRNEEDEYRPTATHGEASILGPTDRSPFWNFGLVDPGETTQTIYNRLYRAPIFKHTPPKTDFLLVKSSTKMGNRFYLRNMKHIYTVGQTLPVIDIPGPHSRKVTTSYKNRLKMIVYRLIRKNDNGRLLVKDLIRHFPDQNELQIRQRLKDFMEFQRKGEDQNFWKLKMGDILPSEEATRAMIDPETVCLIEAMQVGQRHLEDSGYGKSAEADDDQEENMTTEQQLAPWIATRNFINATQGKAMLQLYGEGDPTGRGEGISFIRTSMKGGFKVAGESVNDTLDHDKPLPKGAHAYNVAKQQKAYEDEIQRIWTAQKNTLSISSGQMLDNEALENNGDLEGASPYTNTDVAQSPSAHDSEHDDDMMSMNSAMSANSLNKVLKIQRVTRDDAGNMITTVEIVRDPHVIHAYVQKRRNMEDEDMGIENGEIERSNDEDKNKRMKRKLEDELAKLRRNAERRRIRKIQKEAGLIKSKSKKAKVEA